MKIVSANIAALKVGYLSAIDIFRDLSKEEMEWLHSVTIMETRRKGQLVYTPGETAEGLFLLKKGKVQIYRLSPEGKKLVIAVLGKGTFLGEMSILGQGMYDAFAEALEDCTLCTMRRAEAEMLILSKPVVALRILQVVGKRLLDIQAVLDDMTFKSVPARLASLLLRLVDQEGKDIIYGITHHDLGEIIGATRETTTEALDLFKANGLIEIGRARVTILNRDGLRDIAQDL